MAEGESGQSKHHGRKKYSSPRVREAYSEARGFDRVVIIRVKENDQPDSIVTVQIRKFEGIER
jgi:hypothetical protein